MPPEPPRILQGDFLVTTEDREIELECVSVGGKPAAEVIYFDGLIIDLRINTMNKGEIEEEEEKNVEKNCMGPAKCYQAGKKCHFKWHHIQKQKKKLR